ncbi:hypothetical protein QCA50_020814 [Cerrena zonata]
MNVDQDGELTENLVSVIKQRNAAGFPIEKVVIEECWNMRESDVDLIRKGGVEVEWDRCINTWDHSSSECDSDEADDDDDDDDDDDHYEVQPEDLFDDDDGLYGFY